MNYMESIKYLEEEVGFASVPGLSRIQALLKRLGNPEKKTALHSCSWNQWQRFCCGNAFFCAA